MDKDLRKEMDIEDEYDMVPISPREMQFNIPAMSTYSMEDNVNDEKSRNMMGMNPKCKMEEMQMDSMNKMGMMMNPMGMMMDPMYMSPMHMMNPMGMGPANMCPMPMNPMIMQQMLPCMMYCMNCMKMPQKCMFPMDAMQAPMMPGFMKNDDLDNETEDRVENEENELEEDERYRPQDVDMILKKIEYYNPGIFRAMRSYGIPYEEARRLCRRIISLTLRYYEK